MEKPSPIEAPRLPADVEHFGDEVDGGAFDDDTRYESLRLASTRLADQTARGVVISGCLFIGVSLARSEMPGLDLSDTRFDACDLANVVLQEATVERVEIVGSRLTGFRTFEAIYRDVVLRDCNASLGQFRYTTFKGARFEGCDLSGADFHASDLRGVVFDDCNLTGARLSGTKLDGADLRGSLLDDVVVGFDSLTGAIVEPMQAALLAALAGLDVRWSDG
jgi:uncharacterized protein YjbI with pentapeptide repeats